MTEYFCKECGTTIATSLAFCPSCGSPIAKAEPLTTANTKRSNLRKSPMPKRKKILLGSIIALFILLIGAHFTLVYLTDNTKQLKQVYNAIIDEDADKLLAQLTVPNDLIYDKESYTVGLNNSSLTTLHEELSETVNRVTESGLTEIVKDQSGIEIFRIKRENFLFFYPKITIEPIGQKLTINSDMVNTTLTIAGETFKLEGNPITLNKVLPDNYTVGLKGENTYFESEGTAEIERSIFSKSPKLNLFIVDFSIQLTGTPAESIIYANNISTKKTIKDLSTIGPIFGDKTKFHAVRQISEGKTEESESVIAKPGKKITFNFPLLAQAEVETKAKEEKEIQNLAQTKEDAALIRLASIQYSHFRDAYESALNYRNFSHIEPYLYATGKAYNELNKFIAETDDTYYAYHFITNEVTDGSVEGNKVLLQVLEIFNFENHLGQTTKYERKKEYVFIEASPEVFEITEINIKDTNRNQY